jgi:hypothetical protein
LLKGQLRIREVEAERIRATMASLEVTIRLFKAETAFDDIPAQLPRQPSRFRPGQALRSALSVLRRSDTPMTARDIAAAVMVECNIAGVDEAAMTYVTKSLTNSLVRRVGAGVVRHEGTPALWSVG